MAEKVEDDELDEWVYLTRRDVKRINNAIENVKKNKELINKLDNVIDNYQRIQVGRVRELEEKIESLEEKTLKTINLLKSQLAGEIKKIISKQGQE